jgi:hypothetical protein
MLTLDLKWVPTRLEVHAGMWGLGLEIDATEAGQSGSPVLNDEGRAVGVVVIGSETIQHCVLWEFGTNSVQLRERKSGYLASMRHQMKHLDFLSFLLESRRSVIQNHSPRPLFLAQTQQFGGRIAASHAYLAPESVAIFYALAKT